MHSITRIAHTWLLSEPHALSPIDRVIMDKFLRTLPFEAKKLAGQSHPHSREEVVTVVEGYRAAQALVRGGRTITPEAVPCPKDRPRVEEQPPIR